MFPAFYSLFWDVLRSQMFLYFYKWCHFVTSTNWYHWPNSVWTWLHWPASSSIFSHYLFISIEWKYQMYSYIFYELRKSISFRTCSNRGQQLKKKKNILLFSIPYLDIRFSRILTVPTLVTPLITGSEMFSGVAKPIIVYR